MPKIAVQRELFFRLLGRRLNAEALEGLLPTAKAELEGFDEETIGFELNDTNRPDLWSSAGLARHLRAWLGEPMGSYDFLSSARRTLPAGERRIVVAPELQEIRPYIVSFEAEGVALDDDMLREIIQSQEKLCWNYGRRRRTIAMGIYRAEEIRWPIQYEAVEPESVRFVPLDMTRRMSLREILIEHPKGREFGHIVAHSRLFPYLRDDTGNTLSAPPIINSAELGAVQIGDRRLLVEMTGDDLPTLLTACSIAACDFADFGYRILPVAVEYPYRTTFGDSIATPYYFQRSVSVSLSDVSRLLGSEIDIAEGQASLRRMGVRNSTPSDADPMETLIVNPPPYRNDFIHGVDIIEDIMIGMGMGRFAPEKPTDFTIGRLLPATMLARRITTILVGLGFQEMVYSYLGSHRDLVARIYPEHHWERVEAELVRIANPMSEQREYVRNSILPSLLHSESVSSNAVYSHNLFEIGKIARMDKKENHGSATLNCLGMLVADARADFNLGNSHISALFYYLGKDYRLSQSDDSRFLTGRAAEIVYEGWTIGIVGEIAPWVLEQWHIQVPSVCAEIDLDPIIE